MNKTWLLILLFGIPVVGYGKYSGTGESLSECTRMLSSLPPGDSPKESPERVECWGVHNLDKTPILNDTKWLKLMAPGEPFSISPGVVYENVDTLSIIWEGWTPEDLEPLAATFPNVNHLICEYCDLYKIGAANVFNKLTTVNLNLVKTIPARWRGSTKPKGEFTFDGLPYDQIRTVTLNPTVNSAISCRSIGVWSYKVYQGYWWHTDLPRPYKDYYSCYPDIDKVSEYRIEADDLYRNGDYQAAHELYYKAFLINPYDQNVISSLALTFYRLEQPCKAAQVASSGTKLPNGNTNTRSAIWFNYALALKELGLANEYIEALEISTRIRPTQAKVARLEEAQLLVLAESEACDLAGGWIQEIKSSIEQISVTRSRGH